TIMNFLDENRTSNFINLFDVDNEEIKAYLAIRQKHEIIEADDGAECVSHDKQPLTYAKYQFGSGWFTLSREFCEFIDTSATIAILVYYYKTSLVADESFFQTALLISPFKDRIAPFKRMLEMDHENHDGLHPKTYRAADLETLMRSDALFAR